MFAGFLLSSGQPATASRSAARMALAALALLAAASGTAFAADDPGSTTVAAADTRRPQLEISTSSLPRFDNIDGASRNARIDMTLMPAARSGMGLSLGMKL